VCVSNTDSHDISVFDAREHKELARLETGGAPKRVLVAEIPAFPNAEVTGATSQR